MEENEDNRKMIENVSRRSDANIVRTLQNHRTANREVLGWDQRIETMQNGLRGAVRTRRTQ